MPIVYFSKQFPSRCVCGGRPRAETFLGSNRWWVKCPDCKVHGEGPSEEAVISAWNEYMRRIRWQNSTVKGCCQKPENLRDFPLPALDREIKICQKCGCRHIRMLAEPGRLGLKL
jgi:hypothetical protein